MIKLKFFQLDFPSKGCTDAYVCGIATDVCVGRSHKQALKCLVSLNSDALNLKSMYRINPNCDWEKTQTNALSWLSRGPDYLISCNQLVVPMLDHASTRRSTVCQSFAFVTRPSHLHIRDKGSCSVGKIMFTNLLQGLLICKYARPYWSTRK